MTNDKDNVDSDVKTPDLYECRRLFGHRLKDLREKQGLSTSEVAEKTRVNSEFIVAIESGDFERLPGRLFARGFVAAILKLCTVVDDQLVAEFDDLWTDDGIRQAISHSTKMRLAGKSNAPVPLKDASPHMKRVAAGVFLVVCGFTVLGALWFGYQKGKPHLARMLEKYAKTEGSSDSDAPTASRSLPQGPAAAESTAQDVSSLSRAESPASETVTTDGRQSITIVVLEPVKIKIETDNEKPVVKDFGVGTYKFGFKESTDLLVYDAGAVRISFNGNPIGSLGAKGRVRRIGFRAEGPDKTSF